MGKWVSIHKSMIQTRDLWILGMNIFIDIHQSQLFWGEGTRLLTYFDIPYQKDTFEFCSGFGHYLCVCSVTVKLFGNWGRLGETTARKNYESLAQRGKWGFHTHTQLFSWFKNYFTGYRYIVQAHGFLQNVNHFRSNQKDLSENPKMMYLEDNFPI